MEQTHRQIVDRYNAKRAIFDAMVAGRHISLLDSQEFAVSQMHTTICNIRQEIQDRDLPYEMQDEWIEFGKYKKRCKSYWLVPKVNN